MSIRRILSLFSSKPKFLVALSEPAKGRYYVYGKGYNKENAGDHEELVAEYKLILEKKSLLSSSERRKVVFKVERLVNSGKIKLKEEKK